MWAKFRNIIWIIRDSFCDMLFKWGYIKPLYGQDLIDYLKKIVNRTWQPEDYNDEFENLIYDYGGYDTYDDGLYNARILAAFVMYGDITGHRAGVTKAMLKLLNEDILIFIE